MDTDSNALQATINSLDNIKHLTDNGIEYWWARDLQKLLGYPEWRYFENAINKAKLACEKSGEDVKRHFGDVTKKVTIGDTAERDIKDVALTRYASYLVAMNGNPEITQISFAQTYFAIQTRNQEKLDEVTETQKRLMLRDRVKDRNKHLGKAAKEAGVINYGFFQNAGYQGLYGGLNYSDIKRIKGIDIKEDLLDCISRGELAANEFRITQTEEALKRGNVKGQNQASETHKKVGQQVRDAIEKIGGIMPEKLPKATSLKQINSKSTTKELK
jgi:DNA-damage-inducible protein D